MDHDRCYRFRLHVPEDRLEASYDSSDGSSIDTSFSEDSREGRMTPETMDCGSRFRNSLPDRHYSPERYESSPDGSSTDDSDLGDSRDVCTLREVVLALLPDAEQQLLYLSRHQNIEHSKLDHLWNLVKIIQDEKDRHWKCHENFEVDVHNVPHRGLQEKIIAVKDDVSQETTYKAGSSYELCQAQKQIHQLRQDLNSIRDHYHKKIMNLEQQRVEHKSARKSYITIKQLKAETDELHSELEILHQEFWKEIEKVKSYRSHNNKLQTEKDRQRHENQQLCAKLKRLQSHLQQKENQITTLNRRIKLQTDENVKLKDTVSQVKQQLSNETTELKRKVQLFQKENKRPTKYLKHTKNSGQKQVSNDNIMLQRKNAEMKREIEQMQSEIIKHDEAILKSKEVEEENIKMRNLLKEKETAVITAKEKQRQLSKENSEQQIKVQILTKEVTKLTKDLKNEKDTRRNMESNEISTLQEKNHEQQEEIEKLHLNIKRLGNDLLQQKTNAEEVKKEYKNIQEILKQTNKEKESLITSTEEIQRQLRQKISELENNIEKLHNNKKNSKEDFIQDDERSNKSETDWCENLNLQQQTDKLQKEVDKMRHENKFLKEKIKSERDNFQTKENELRNEFRQRLKEKESFNQDLKSAKEMVMKDDTCYNKNLHELYETLQKDVENLHNQNLRLNDALKLEKENVRRMEKEHSKEKSEFLEKMERQQQNIVNLKTKLAENKARPSKVNERVNTKLDSEQDLQQRLTDTLDRLKHMQKELDDTKYRLSRAMGDKLTDNNPNIADLSDKNRPTKISERYQELYDNQWTDAFEIVNGACRNEENTINILRIILKDTLEFCQAQAANQMIQIKASFLKGEELPANMVKQLKDCRKAMAEQYGKQLYKEYWAHLSASKSEKASHAMRAQSYVKECFEICWLMTVQDPPVVFGADIHRNDVFNKDHYKAYTRSGDRVEYVVWPVLLLHQNGPVLCKGVAQGK